MVRRWCSFNTAVRHTVNDETTGKEHTNTIFPRLCPLVGRNEQSLKHCTGGKVGNWKTPPSTLPHDPFPLGCQCKYIIRPSHS